MNKQKQLLLAGAILCVLSLGTFTDGAVHAAGKSPMQMAERLAELRKEVDGLAGELEEKKEEMKGRIRSYATQKAEVEAEIQRAKMRLAQLQESHSKRVEKLSEEDEQVTVLTPAVLEAIGMLKQKVSEGIPFKRKERLAELDRLIRQIDEKLLHPVNAFARVWDQAEDEFRLSRESGLYKQVVTLDGKETLADVIRVGMVMMYVKTKDGQIGKSVYQEGTWSFRTLRSPEEHRQVLYLFDSFKKQIRTGLFTVPNAIPQGTMR
ncbi:MAG: DUF3450 family protein [Deltaproteobacteria bacterium]|nr:DUF3450 family protein [Deltaproteobacteria bacterium]MBN2671539.1 DUF3450 family protein [Deltaproteobacteria bacterium]